MSVLRAAVGSLDSWLFEPASLLDEWWQAIGPGRQAELVLLDQGDALQLASGGGRGGAAEEIPLQVDGEGAKAADRRLAEIVSGRRVNLVLPSAWIITRRIELPVEAASHLPGIVASRLNALSPLPRNEVLHGYRIIGTDRKTGKMSLALAILPKAKVTAILAALSRPGPRRIELKAPFPGNEPIKLVSGQAMAASASGAKWLLGILLVLAVAGALSSFALGTWHASELETRRAELERRAETARDRIAAASAPVTAETLPEQVAKELKEDSISIIGALDDLAEALPLHAHATEISIENGILRLSGRTSDLPAVLTALESSGRFAGSRLVGTATRAEDGGLSTFVVQSRPLIRTGGELR